MNFFTNTYMCNALSATVPAANTIVSVTLVYGAATLLSAVLLIGCSYLVLKNRLWFIILFASVFIVNTGYTLLALSADLSAALWANRLSYLGSVFLPFSMLMIILQETGIRYSKKLPYVLLGFAVVMFLLAASPGILPIYYKEVAYSVVNGACILVKVYGPLHPLYLLYLLGYFAAMVAVILNAHPQKSPASIAHAVFVALAVFLNIGVWGIEQLIRFDFEFLAISYIISESFLLGAHLIINENQRLNEIVNRVQALQSAQTAAPAVLSASPQTVTSEYVLTPEQIELYTSGLGLLTPTEKVIYEAHLARMTSKEIMASLNIKESTLKFHNRNIYEKLGVATRKELLEVHKAIQRIQKN